MTSIVSRRQIGIELVDQSIQNVAMKSLEDSLDSELASPNKGQPTVVQARKMKLVKMRSQVFSFEGDLEQRESGQQLRADDDDTLKEEVAIEN